MSAEEIASIETIASKLNVMPGSFAMRGVEETAEPGDDLYEEISALEQAMVSEEKQQEGTFLTGGNKREFVDLGEEKTFDEAVMLNPRSVIDGKPLLVFLRENLHRFDSPYAYIGGEANSPDRGRYATAEVKILQCRLSSYEAVSLSMTHSLMAQIYEELPYTFTDLAFMPKPSDYNFLKENGFSVWFGTNTKLAPNKFDLMSISHAVSMEQLNFVALLHDSGIPIFKQQRMEREDIPLVVVGGANSGTTAPLCGIYKAKDGTEFSCFIDAVIYGDGEEAGKELVEVIREGKQKGWSKREVLRACHGRVQGFYEPDLYEHMYNGQGRITSIAPKVDYVEFPVKRATVRNLDTVRTLETKILPFTGDGASVDVAIAGCHRAGTLVATERGRLPIEQIQAGDRVMTRSGLKTVKKLWANGPKQFYRLATKWGLEVESTENHHFLTAGRKSACVENRFYQSNYASLGDLKAGDLLVIKEGCSALTEPKFQVILSEEEEAKQNYGGTLRGGGAPRQRKDVTLPDVMTPDLAELLGYLEGDGSLSLDATRFSYAWHERELQTDYDEKMLRLFGVRPGLPQKKDGAYEVPFQSRTVREFLEKIGVKTGRVPEVIRTATAASKAAYIRGLFTADGTCGGKQATIALSGCEKDLMRDVQLVLLDLGIYSAVDLAQKVHKKKGTNYECRDLWRVSVRGGSSWRRFRDLVGFAVRAKQRILEEYNIRQEGTFGRFQEGWTADQVLSVSPTVVAESYDLWVEDDPSYTVNGLVCHNSVGCIGSAGWGACSFCREGSEGPYRERSLPFVMKALDQATKNQGTKEVSFFSLNFNQYTDLFPLVERSVEKGYEVGLISQRVDMLAETPEQIHVQRWLKKSNFTLGVEGISQRMRAFLNKNVQEWEILKVIKEMMIGGAGELKLFYILTNMETEVDMKEWCVFAERVNAIREQLGSKTRFRISFTPLFPSAFTALQFGPCLAATNYGVRNLDGVFAKARDLGWGRRLSVSGEEPLVSNTINHGGRNITNLLLHSHFVDGFRFYGSVPKGTWERWQRRVDKDPNVNLDEMWGEKQFDYIFPWEDIAYATSKEVMYRGYIKAVSFQGIPYCLTTPTIKGECHANECGACDPDKTGQPDKQIIHKIVGRIVSPAVSVKKIERMARSREKAYHLRVLVSVDDPIYRFVEKSYFGYIIPRAFMQVSDRFTNAFVKAIGHARIGAGVNLQRDWVYGQNIYDFSLCEIMSETELRELVPEANKHFGEGRIIDARLDRTSLSLRKEVDYAVYTMLMPAEDMSYKKLRDTVGKYMERREDGKIEKVRVKKAIGKDIFRMVEKELGAHEIRMVQVEFRPELRGSIMRMVVSAGYNVLSLLEGITGLKSFKFKKFPIYCDGYVQLQEKTGEVDVFSVLEGTASSCNECAGPMELDLFSGKSHESGICMECDLEKSRPVNPEVFFTKLLQVA